MSYAAATATTTQAETMSFFRGVSNAELAEMLRQDRAQASKEAGAELGPIFLKIARGEPVDLQEPTTPPQKTGAISGLLARIGL
jgi:hypothetical protein